MTAHQTIKCTCAVPPESGREHDPTCPVTPLRDEAIRRAAVVLADIRADLAARAKQSA